VRLQTDPAPAFQQEDAMTRVHFRQAAIALFVLGNVMPGRAGARPLTLEDYYRIVNVQSPAMSPDGRLVAFLRTTIVEAENRRQVELWIAPTDGSAPPYRVSDPALSASAPRWSADGKLLAFSGRRRGAPSSEDEGDAIWFVRTDHLDEPAFHIKGVGGIPIFSPDNKWIAFTRRTEKPAPPVYGSESEKTINERFKGKAYEWLNYRFDQRGYLPDPRDPKATPPEELFIVARDGGEPKALTNIKVNVSGAAWRPDSGALAFVANEYQRDEYTYSRADLWTVAIDGTTARLTNDGYDHNSPAWSPDGKTIAVRRELGLTAVIAARQSHGAPVDIIAFATTGGAPRNLTANWDLLPGAPGWSPDGRFVYFSAGIGGNSHLFRADAYVASGFSRTNVASGVSRTNTVEQITQGDRHLAGFSPSSRWDAMAYTGTDSARPDELYVSAIDGSGEKRLTSFNDAFVKDVEPAVAERIHYSSKDGTPIEGWVLEPRGYDASRTWPLILTMHGGPHAAYGNEFSFEHQLFAANGYLVVYTNPRGSTNYGEQFLWATWGGWGNRDFDDVMSGVDYAQAHYRVDEKRLGVTGYSYGGFLTNWVIGHTARFAAAISGAGISNWISDYGTSDIPRTKESEFLGPPWDAKAHEVLRKQSPIEYVANVKTPTLFVDGESDARVPIEEAEQMYTALRKLRVPARMVRYPDSYHGGWSAWNTVHRYYEELKWWDRYLGPRFASAMARIRMPELIHEHLTHVRTREGERFIARTYGEPDETGLWHGWLVFESIDRPSVRLTTDAETSQPNRAALAYWAEGIEPVYLEGAFARAQLSVSRK
jgi:dipeptidyl aminopeptidase/acylaminoacyl peptidase